MIAVELVAKKKPNDRHWYAYDVLIDGRIIVVNSRDPEHDLARALLARGINGMAEVIDRKTGKSRSRLNIEKAAKWCAGSNLERYKFKPREIADSSPHTGEERVPGRKPAKGIAPGRTVAGISFVQKSPPAMEADRGPPRSEAA